MSAADIDEYLATIDDTPRATLEALRRTILELVPDAEQCVSYGLPAFRVHGKVVAGFGAFARHCSYLPHSGSVLPELRDQLEGYGGTKSSLHFPLDTPLPRPVVALLIEARLRQIGHGS
ncbi:MAG: DUF1801 domain-containing protein [Acidimicrobiales bacterium]